jgi:hypothetical protein
MTWPSFFFVEWTSDWLRLAYVFGISVKCSRVSYWRQGSLDVMGRYLEDSVFARRTLSLRERAG